MSHCTNVVLIDDGTSSVTPLRLILAETPELMLTGQINYRSSLIPYIQLNRPDIIVMEFRRVSIAIIWQIVKLHLHTTNIQLLACLIDPIPDDVWGLLTAGVTGYLHVDDVPEKLLIGIEQIQQGGVWWSPTFAPLLQQWSSIQTGPHILLPNSYEMAIVTLIAEGQTNRQIAHQLGISERAIRFHLEQLYKRWGVNTRTQAALFAQEHGWLDVDA